MKILAWAVGLAIALFVAMLIIGASVSPEKAAQYSREAQADEMCAKMMADSALGNERRMTRRMCDGLKEKIRTKP